MALREVVIEDRTLAASTPERRMEWDALVEQLLEPSNLTFRDDVSTLEIGVTEQHWHLAARNGDALVTEVLVPAELLAELIREYVDIVRQMGDDRMAPGSSRLDALDMAKKVTHDKAGRLLKRQCTQLGLDHSTARRLYSLLLALRIDTTKLHGIHGHRAVR